MPDGRWDFLEGVRPITAVEAIVQEFAKHLAGELAEWPPRMEWSDLREAARFADVLEHRPSDAAVAQGFRLARLDLIREQEAIDAFMRGDPPERKAIELVWRYLTEAALELAERTEQRVKRPHLVDSLELAERLLSARRG